MTSTPQPLPDSTLPAGWRRADLSRLAFMKGKAPKHFIDSDDIGYIPYLTPDYLRNIATSTLYCSVRRAVIVGAGEPIVLWDGSNAGEVFLSKEGALASTMCKVITPPTVLPKHLFYFLKSKEAEIKARAKGSGIPHVDKYIFGELNAAFPISSAEQEAIVALLTLVDDLIALSEAVVSKLKRVSRGLMQDLLTRGIDESGVVRSENTHRFKASRLGPIPAEWDVTSIGAIANHVGSGITPRGGSEVYKTEGIIFIRSQNVTFDGLLLDDVAYLDEATHKSMNRSEVFQHDVLLNITGASIGRCCPVPEGLGLANVNQHVCVIRLPHASRVDAMFLAAILASPIGQSQIDRLNAGGNRQGLNYEQLRAFMIPWPAPEERARGAALLEVANARIRTEEVYCRKLWLIKRGLMDDLLSGKVRADGLVTI